MSLTKNYQYTYHPAVAEVPYRAAYTVCQQQTSGHWETQTSAADITALWNSGNFGIRLSGSSYVMLTYADGTVIKLTNGGYNVLVQGSEWMSTGGYTPTGSTTAALSSAVIYTTASVWVDTTNSSNVVCTTYPEQAYVAGQAAYAETAPLAGWNAGANSVDSQTGDCEVAFGMGLVVGVIVGLTTDLEDVADYTRLTHALYFHQDTGGHPVYSVIESGQIVRAAESYALSDTWAIRRVGATVSYFRNSLRVMVSQAPSSGELSVGSALYYSGDMIE